jgi:hypothetical protein
MNIKKIIFTSITIPLGYNTWWAFNWQKRRKIEKIQEIELRVNKLR